MTEPTEIVIIGGGLAGAKGAQALRENGYRGSLTLVAEETELPYERPPLSKSYLSGSSPFEDAVVHPQQWYADNDVDLRRGVRAASIERDSNSVVLEDGTRLHYDRLLLATGSTPRRLPLPGGDAEGVHTLRTRADADAIRTRFGDGRQLVVIGAGWIGLEVAAAARGAGSDVTIVESLPLPLLRVLGPEMAAVFAALHRDNGVQLLLETSLAEIVVEDGSACGVRLADGSVLAADAIVVGVGVSPNVALAAEAGLDVENGVLVDAQLRSSDPAIFAVGDIANHHHPIIGRVRVEHWATALNQPATAAAAMLGGAAPYVELPYFFSDQYDLGMEYLGHVPSGVDHRVVVRGDLDAREFVAFWLDPQNRIAAVMNVNVWDVIDAVKPYLAEQRAVDPDRLADPAIDWSQLG